VLLCCVVLCERKSRKRAMRLCANGVVESGSSYFGFICEKFALNSMPHPCLFSSSLSLSLSLLFLFLFLGTFFNPFSLAILPAPPSKNFLVAILSGNIILLTHVRCIKDVSTGRTSARWVKR